MIEIKVVPTKVLSKPKLAIVLGYSIKAEPDATLGAWCGSRGIDDMFFICNNTDQAIVWIKNINSNGVSVAPFVEVDQQIKDYLST